MLADAVQVRHQLAEPGPCLTPLLGRQVERAGAEAADMLIEPVQPHHAPDPQKPLGNADDAGDVVGEGQHRREWR